MKMLIKIRKIFNLNFSSPMGCLLFHILNMYGSQRNLARKVHVTEKIVARTLSSTYKATTIFITKLL